MTQLVKAKKPATPKPPLPQVEVVRVSTADGSANDSTILQQFEGNGARLVALAITKDTLPKVLRPLVYVGVLVAGFAKYKGWW